MPITKNSGRQEVVAAYVDINLADLATGVEQAAIDMPVGAVVVGGEVTVSEVFNSTTSDGLDVGFATDPDGFTATAVDLQALGTTALDLNGLVFNASNPAVTVTWTSGGGTPTTGILRLGVRYVVEGRTAFSQG